MSTDPPTRLPDDAQDILRLHVELCDSQQIRPSIEAVLIERGQLYSVNGKGKLASRRAYLDALESFCAKVGLSVAAVNDVGSARRHNDQMQRRNDETNSAYLRRMGYRGPK